MFCPVKLLSEGTLHSSDIAKLNANAPDTHDSCIFVLLMWDSNLHSKGKAYLYINYSLLS